MTKPKKIKPEKKNHSKPDTKDAVALHLEHKDGVHHIVGLGNIRVIIVPDEEFWFAQGLEVDYSAQGDTVEDVKSNFEEGLSATIEQHLKIYGHIKSLLKPAPQKIWEELVSAQSTKHKGSFSLLGAYTIKLDAKKLSPYEGISYLLAA